MNSEPLATYTVESAEQCLDLCSHDPACLAVEYGTSRGFGSDHDPHGIHAAGSCRLHAAWFDASADDGKYSNVDVYFNSCRHEPGNGAGSIIGAIVLAALCCLCIPCCVIGCFWNRFPCLKRFTADRKQLLQGASGSESGEETTEDSEESSLVPMAVAVPVEQEFAASRTCRSCNTKQDVDAKFCGVCGTAMD